MDSLRALRSFVRVVETGSFSAVAREAGESHSAIARQVQTLEAHFGVRLIHRTTRRLSLTDDGQDLLLYAQRMLEVADAMESDLGRHREMPSGLVRLGAPVGLGVKMAGYLPSLFARYPELRVELVMQDHFTDLVEQRLDLAVVNGEIADSSLIRRKLGMFDWLAVAAPDYVARRGEPLHPGDLQAHDCICYIIGQWGTEWHFPGPDGMTSVHVPGVLSVNNSEALRRAALAGLGIALAPAPVVAEDLMSGRLRHVLRDHPLEQSPIWVVYPSRRHLAPRTRVVIDFVTEQVRGRLEEVARRCDGHGPAAAPAAAH